MIESRLTNRLSCIEVCNLDWYVGCWFLKSNSSSIYRVFEVEPAGSNRWLGSAEMHPTEGRQPEMDGQDSPEGLDGRDWPRGSFLGKLSRRQPVRAEGGAGRTGSGWFGLARAGSGSQLETTSEDQITWSSKLHPGVDGVFLSIWMTLFRGYLNFGSRWTRRRVFPTLAESVRIGRLASDGLATRWRLKPLPSVRATFLRSSSWCVKETLFRECLNPGSRWTKRRVFMMKKPIGIGRLVLKTPSRDDTLCRCPNQVSPPRSENIYFLGLRTKNSSFSMHFQ